MSTEQIAALLQTLIGLTALWALWHFGWRRFALDAYRQDLFEIRDRLFDLALESKHRGFDFSHRSYGQLRTQIHASIRFAHRTNSLRVILFLLLSRFVGPRFSVARMAIERREQIIAPGADCGVEVELKALSQDWDRALVRFLQKTSPLYWAALTILIVTLIAKGLFSAVAAKLRKPQGVYYYSMGSVYPQATGNFTKTAWAEIAIAEAMNEERADAARAATA